MLVFLKLLWLFFNMKLLGDNLESGRKGTLETKLISMCCSKDSTCYLIYKRRMYLPYAPIGDMRIEVVNIEWHGKCLITIYCRPCYVHWVREEMEKCTARQWQYVVSPNRNGLMANCLKSKALALCCLSGSFHQSCYSCSWQTKAHGLFCFVFLTILCGTEKLCNR